MASLSIFLLGRFQVQRNSQVIGGFSTDKTRALLACLAIESDRSHRRQALAGLFWPDSPETAARTSLRTALANLRNVLGDHEADPPLFLASRQTIAINPEANIWVDANIFDGLLKTEQGALPDSDTLVQAVGLYRGRFLQGFSLADSAPFDDWTLLKREYLERRMMAALDTLTKIFKRAGDLETALTYARRRVELDPWQEPAQRELMWLLAANGRRAAALAQYEKCRELLAEELGVEPETETTRLYQLIRDGNLGDDVSTRRSSITSASAVPANLAVSVNTKSETPVFVGRQRELGLLHGYLQKANAGHGRVIFIIGGAGRGKSVLLEEFARQVTGRSPHLVATGYCNAYSGPGDPYLPFRQALEQLTGNLGNKWLAEAITKEQLALVENASLQATRAVVEVGPDLIETFLAGQPLFKRASSLSASDVELLGKLHRLVNDKSASQGPTNATQFTLIDQYANVVERIAQRYPLLLIIEDLHWADQGSIDLLLHLGRRLAKSRILILCAYRPDEIVKRPYRKYQPIQDLVNELISLHGDIIIDLANDDRTASEKFLDELLDLEANRYDAEFRQALHSRTGGHPLFTVEMLRMLKEQGDVVKDADGHWVAGQALVWDTVPAKVEAVIQKRVGRLQAEEYELLTVACVEGEEFSAEVVAQVLSRSPRQVLHVLNKELGHKHRLLRERGEMKTGKQTISRFRFSHQLIQHYLYSTLTGTERRLLHEGVAKALETLFADDIESITIPLAYHYDQTEAKDKALHYLTEAGHQARRRYDGRQAESYFSKAISLVPVDSSEHFHLLAARASVHDLLAQREDQKADIDAMAAVALTSGNRALQCDALLALSSFYLATEIFRAREPALQARAIAQAIGDSVREAHALRLLSWEGRLGADFQTAHKYLWDAATRFAEAAMPGEAADCLFMLARRLPGSAKHIFDLDAAEQAMELSRQSSDRRLEAIALKNLAIAYTNLDKDFQALPLVEEALEIQRELGDRREQCNTLDVLGVILARLGRRQEAVSTFQRCLTLSEEIGSDWGIAGAVFGFWNYWFVANGEYEQFLNFLDARLKAARHAKREWLAGFLSWLKTLMLMELGQLEDAHAISQTDEYQVTEGDPVSQVFVSLLTGSIKAELGDSDEARQYLNQAHKVAEETADQYVLSWPLVALANLALIESKMNAIRDAVAQAEQAIVASRAIWDERQLAEGLDVMVRLHLQLDQPEIALENSSELMQLLDSYYWLPRPQNYLYTHALTLQALGRQADFEGYLQRAYERVMYVAGKLTEESIRDSWLQRVRVNRAIMRDWQKISSTG